MSNLFPGTNSLLKPKSAIFIFISPSNSKFSACKTNKYHHFKTNFKDKQHNITVSKNGRITKNKNRTGPLKTFSISKNSKYSRLEIKPAETEKNNSYIDIYTHTHTHTHTCISFQNPFTLFSQCRT